MSHFVFIHDFYRDGYNDMLAEVQDLQVQGLWTKERRARATQDELSTYKALKHKFPCMDTSYWAGRVAAIKSAVTAEYPVLPKVSAGKMAFVLLPDRLFAFCGSCGEPAVWSYSPGPSGSLTLLRCDRCRQEVVRAQTCYITPDGWDWQSREEPLPPLPVRRGDKLAVKEQLEQASIFLPTTAMLGLGLLNLSLHVPITLFVMQAVLVLHFIVWGKDLFLKFCKWLLESEL